MSAFDLDGYLKDRRALVDAALERLLPGEDAPPPGRCATSSGGSTS